MYSSCMSTWSMFLFIFVGFWTIIMNVKCEIQKWCLLACVCVETFWTVSSANLNHMQPCTPWHSNDSTAHSVPWCLEITIDPIQTLIIFFITTSHEHVITSESQIQMGAVCDPTLMQDEMSLAQRWVILLTCSQTPGSHWAGTLVSCIICGLLRDTFTGLTH